jgi:sulfite oxidase
MPTTTRRLIHDTEELNTAFWPVPAGELLTPSERLFTRSHGPVPRLEPGSWRLEVDGLVERPGSFTLDQLVGAFHRREVAATLVCAGLRRDELLAVAPLPGELPWGPEPAGTGEWSGVALRDVLEAVGVAAGARHVELIGLDRVERQGRRFGFGGSIDLAKAIGGEVLLADRLNGQPLPPVHGFPLRALVPGWIGARSVKWLGRIRLSAEPSANYFQTRAYRILREPDPRDPRDVSAGEALSTAPLNAVILEPVGEQVVAAGPVLVRGWAMGAGGCPVRSVEVTADEGRGWTAARLAAGGSDWTWTLWETTLELGPGRHVLAARATDSAGTRQPASLEATWNVKGYNNNAWHRVVLVVRG